MTDRELMQQAREGLEEWRWGNDPRGADVYIDALRDRLAQSERQWVGLTYQEIVELQHLRDWTTCWSDVTYTRAVEAKLKEKNSDNKR
jgi:hypothetical protein